MSVQRHGFDPLPGSHTPLPRPSQLSDTGYHSSLLPNRCVDRGLPCLPPLVQASDFLTADGDSSLSQAAGVAHQPAGQPRLPARTFRARVTRQLAAASAAHQPRTLTGGCGRGRGGEGAASGCPCGANQAGTDCGGEVAGGFDQAGDRAGEESTADDSSGTRAWVANARLAPPPPPLLPRDEA